MRTDVVPHVASPARTRGTVVWKASAFCPRRSERILSALGSPCLIAFLVAQFFSLTRLFFVRQLGEGAAEAASIAGTHSVVLLLPAVLAYGVRARSPFGTLTRRARLWVAGLGALSVFLFLRGWIGKEHALGAAAEDLCPYLVIAAAVVLGSSRRAWRDVNPALVGLFLAGLVLSVVALTGTVADVEPDLEATNRNASSVAHGMQGALAFWPLLLLTARRRRPLTALLVCAGVLFVFAQQLLLQEHGSSVRVLLHWAVFLLVLPRLGPPEGEHQPARPFALSAAPVVALAALAAAPWLLEAPAARLGQRANGTAAGEATRRQSAALAEAGAAVRTLEAGDLVLGLGFGGRFVPGAAGPSVPPGGRVGRRDLRVGALMPFLTGGLVLAFVYYAGLAYALWRGRRSLREPIGAAAFFVVLIHALFLVQDRWFTMSVSFDLFAVGLCMGHLLSRERDGGAGHGARLIVVDEWPRGVAA
jgi:hypothetical protein